MFLLAWVQHFLPQGSPEDAFKKSWELFWFIPRPGLCDRHAALAVRVFFLYFFLFSPLRTGSATATVLSAWGHPRAYRSPDRVWQRISQQQQTRLQRGVHPREIIIILFYFLFFFVLSYLTSDFWRVAPCRQSLPGQVNQTRWDHMLDAWGQHGPSTLSQETSKEGKGEKRNKEKKGKEEN